VRRLHTLASQRTSGPVSAGLTNREREILVLVDQGSSNKEIARRLGIEVATVKNHVHNILEKLRVRRRAEAAAKVAGRLRRPSHPGGRPSR
jgi:DNA-binding NarL/FixJ family response regulator